MTDIQYYQDTQKLECPECKSFLQSMPKVGCYYGDGCTHGCGNCGMHWTLEDD